MPDRHHSLPRNPNIFANNPLDRGSALRTDPTLMAEKLNAPNTLVVPFWKLQPLILPPVDEESGPDAGWLRLDMVKEHRHAESIEIYLGDKGGRSYFAVDLDPDKDPSAGPLSKMGSFEDLRMAGSVLPAGDAAIMAQAKSMIDWHNRHGFCSVCGAKSNMAEAGYKRECPECKAEHFPRTDPVVIMLVIDGDRALLGRGPGWPPKMFSALAGFVEPGESIEEAVAREVWEEVGIKTKSVVYHSTQPWPFPSSLMIGCVARAETTEINVDTNELEDAQWFTKEELKEAIERSLTSPPFQGPKDAKVWAPGPIAIAHQILKAWTHDGFEPE